MIRREDIVRKLEVWFPDESEIGKQMFFDAMIEASQWNRDHPEDPIRPLVGGRVPPSAKDVRPPHIEGT